MKNLSIIKNKFIVIIISVVTFFSLLETSLRIAGNINLRKSNINVSSDKRNNVYTILCLGDSFTFGLGAPRGKGYPEQLEGMLNEYLKSNKFRIINKGIKSYNTTQILNELKYTLKNIKPDLVIIMGGRANYWNYRGYHVYLRGNNILSVLNDNLYRIRTYKLIKLLFLNIGDRYRNNLLLQSKNEKKIRNTGNNNKSLVGPDYCGNGWFYKDQGNYDEAIKWFKEGIRLNLSNDSCYTGMARIYEDQGNYDEAIKWFKEGIRLNPSNSNCYVGLGRLYKDQGNYDEAIKWFKEGIRLYPNNSNCYVGLGWAYKDQGNYDEAIKWFKEGIRFDGNDGGCYAGVGWTYIDKGDNEKGIEYLKKAVILKPEDDNILATLNHIYMILGKYNEMVPFLNELSKNKILSGDFEDILRKIKDKKAIDGDINKWIVSDFKEIIKLCRENKIKILLQDYPFGMTEILQKISKENSVPFISNYKVFLQLWDVGEKKNDYFVTDGHCNVKGYGAIAKNLFNKIITEKMFNID